MDITFPGMMMTYAALHWADFIGYLKEYSEVTAAVVEKEFNDELSEAIDSGEVTMQALDEAIQDKLDAFISIDWPDGIDYQPDDLVEVMPDHVYITFPGSELILCDLINVKDFIDSVPWQNITTTTFEILGAIWQETFIGCILNWIFQGSAEWYVPWSRKFQYRDAETGDVMAGEDFTPEKHVFLRPILLKSLAIAVIISFVRKTGMVKKIWEALKGIKAYKNKKLVRKTLLDLTAGQTDLDVLLHDETQSIFQLTKTLQESVITVDAVILEMKAMLVFMHDKFKSAYSPQKGVFLL